MHCLYFSANSPPTTDLRNSVAITEILCHAASSLSRLLSRNTVPFPGWTLNRWSMSVRRSIAYLWWRKDEREEGYCDLVDWINYIYLFAQQIWLNGDMQTEHKHDWNLFTSVLYVIFVIFCLPVCRCKHVLYGRRCIFDRQKKPEARGIAVPLSVKCCESLNSCIQQQLLQKQRERVCWQWKSFSSGWDVCNMLQQMKLEEKSITRSNHGKIKIGHNLTYIWSKSPSCKHTCMNTSRNQK